MVINSKGYLYLSYIDIDQDNHLFCAQNLGNDFERTNFRL